jgi:hypothetical protein
MYRNQRMRKLAMKKCNKSLPKPRNSLHQVLAMKATSNAAGKHDAKKSKKLRRLKRINHYDEDFCSSFFLVKQGVTNGQISHCLHGH